MVVVIVPGATAALGVALNWNRPSIGSYINIRDLLQIGYNLKIRDSGHKLSHAYSALRICLRKRVVIYRSRIPSL
ncbi:hypothetical protein BdWA1_000723 [Babesia duncani]|uniref:Uncharacterized protein n=1 Tax=Babesia duncani TaxID=323732 RepID=A0AAD9PMP7_9APIC|nr:hypothetical protein BdWA1_000723 [Babesia duncani]